MGRRPRDDEPGAYYHVTTRGNDRRPIQTDPIDCGIWERTLAVTAREHAWEVLAYCLLTNHFHLVLRLPQGGLSEGMCLLNGGYAKQFNKRHGRCDHVFGRRFWSKRITTRGHLLGAAAYIDLNPVLAGLAPTPEAYRFSSHAAIVGLAEPPAFLSVDAVLGLFSPLTPTAARTAYRRLVRDGHVTVPGTVTEPSRPRASYSGPL
jgi:putative transposase